MFREHRTPRPNSARGEEARWTRTRKKWIPALAALTGKIRGGGRGVTVGELILLISDAGQHDLDNLSVRRTGLAILT